MFLTPQISKGKLTRLATNVLNAIRSEGLKPQAELDVLYAQAENDPVRAFELISELLKTLRINTLR